MDALCLLYLGALVPPHDAHGRRCRSVGWLVAHHSASHGGRPLPLEGMPCQLIRWALPLPPWALRWRSLSSVLALQTAFSGGHTISPERGCTVYVLVWPVGTDPHVCLLSNPAQCALSTCLALDTDGQRLLACLAPAWSGTADAAGFLCLGQPL